LIYLSHIPALIRALYPHWTWRYDTPEKVLYLTFDDGPTPEITPFVLDQLAQYEARATFFLIGNNVEKYPELAQRIVAAGHAIGNHTQHHVRGRKTDIRSYLEEVAAAQQAIARHTGLQPRLFRPPYGSLTRRQSCALRNHFEIAMMDVISGDFEHRRSGERCARTVIRHARPGSVVLFHDSFKARARVTVALPQVLAHFQEQGYRFAAMPSA
jgi:peptidoglycan/xylan/chitin deacetylase (PgdA/CDA1 family)